MSLSQEPPYFEHDLNYMKQAYDLAVHAGALGEVPVGAVVVDRMGTLIGQGFNRTEIEKSQNAHAEIFALKHASETIGDWRLEGCTLYVTLQPCLSCWGLASLSRIERIVWGAVSPVYGFHLGTKDLPGVYTKHTKFFSSGVMKDDIETLLKEFFKQRRI